MYEINYSGKNPKSYIWAYQVTRLLSRKKPGQPCRHVFLMEISSVSPCRKYRKTTNGGLLIL